MNRKIVVFLSLYLLFVGSIVFTGLINRSHIPLSEENSSISIKDNNLTEPEPLEGSVYDIYANGEIIKSGDPISSATSNSTHPVTKDEFQLLNLDEIVVLPFIDGWNPKIYDDISGNYNYITSLPETIDLFSSDDTHGYLGDLALGDVDGDGLDEIILADEGGWGHIKIYDDANANYIKIGDYEVANPTGYYKCLTTGDIDGDGCDEIIYTRYIQGSTIPEGIGCSVALWVYKFLPTWTCLTPYNYRVKDGYYQWSTIFNGAYDSYFQIEPDVACGDIDGDGCDEIAVVFPFRNSEMFYEDIWLFDYDINGGDFIRTWSSYVFTDLTGDVDLTFGDFDGDGREEIAFASCPWSGSQLDLQIAIIDDDLSVNLLDKIPATGDGWVFRCPVVAGDLDGDGRDEIAVSRAFYNAWGEIFLYDYQPTDGEYNEVSMYDDWCVDWTLAMGDVDCDGLAEIISGGRSFSGILQYNATDNSFSRELITEAGGLIACGDLDGDGMRLRYTNESWTNKGPPGIIAVMAAPPLYDELQQNAVSSYTAFGQETSTGTGVSSEIGTSVSTTYSYEQTFDFEFFELFKFSWSRTLGKEFIQTQTKIKTLVKTVSFATGSSDDAIIYHSTDYTSYKYQIIYHPFKSSLVGQNITIDIPDPPLIIPWTLKTFNTYYNQTIGEVTLPHTPGKPWTYLNSSELSTIAPVHWWSGEQIVGQGSGFTTVSIEVETIVGSTMEQSVSSDYGTGLGIAGFTFDRYSGLFSSHAYEIEVGEATIYEGCVGFIQDYPLWEKHRYTYNMFVYYLNHSDGYTFQVINYYVDGATPLTDIDKFAEYLRLNWEMVLVIGGGVILIVVSSIVIPLIIKHKKGLRTG